MDRIGTGMVKNLITREARSFHRHVCNTSSHSRFILCCFVFDSIVAACSELLNHHECGFVKSEQWTDRAANLFFQRILFDYLPANTDKVLAQEQMNELSHQLGVKAHINWRDRPKRVAVMVSKYNHCLWELLLRHGAGDLDCEIPLVISNHPDLKPVADTFGIPYKVFPITAETKVEQEQMELDVLQEYKIDTIVLARYMQVLSDNFLQTYPNNIINIHHSFLPAFSGGKAYHQANERGVKLIGATAHYASPELDEGPIMAQDVISVSHRDEVHDFIRKGRILERNILVHALQAHLDDRIIVYDNKCVVFGD